MKHAIAYVRISTHDGRQTVENQTLAISQFLERQQDMKLIRMFQDEASGGNFERPGLKELKNYCQAHKVDALIVWKLDRLGRSTLDLLKTLEWLAEKGVHFISITESIDTTTPSGRLLLSFLAALAEYERALIKERVKSGLVRAKASGTHLGRPRKAFDVAAALAMRTEGIGFRRIAEKLGVSKSIVHRCLADVPQTPLPKAG